MIKNYKLQVKNLFKVFGKSNSQIEKALIFSSQNISRKEIYEKTGSLVAVRDVSIEVSEGETLVIMGLSGSGKSTLLRCLNGLYCANQGEVKIDDQNITNLKEKHLLSLRKKKFGMVFQQFGLFPHRTVKGNVTYGLEIQKYSQKEQDIKAKEALKLVGLEDCQDMYIGELSGGMKQRVGIARALAIDPDILLMDEAFSALDPVLRVDMQNELLNLQKKLHKTLVFVTHDIEEAIRLGDRIAIMQDGSIVQIGTPQEILFSPANSFIEDFLANIDPYDYLTIEALLRRKNILEEKTENFSKTNFKRISSQKTISEVIRFFLGEEFLEIYDRNHEEKVLGLLSRNKLSNYLKEEKI